MFEHVGPKNHRAFMETVRRCLRPDGLALLHFFATQRSWPNLKDSEALWVARRIFPNFVTPSPAQVDRATRGLFVLEDLHNFGSDYDPTLMAWHERFTRAWNTLRAHYNDRFYRTWSFYLNLSAGAFRSRKYQLWQLVLSPRGVPGGYRSVRTLEAPIVAPGAGLERAHA
jgi:cyclopropane-fatty-acyl-phospholipid synthase